MPVTGSHPLTIDNWQSARAEGMINLQSIIPNLMTINAQTVYRLNYQAINYDLHEIPSVARLLSHPAVAGLVVMKASGEVLLEHYNNGNGHNTTFSIQSSTKAIGYLLLNRALKAGKISLDDKVEQYIPEIGSGFWGRSVADVAAMAVHHNVAELAAYTGDPEAMVMYDRDERVIGLARNDEKETLRQFIEQIEASGEAGSNQWQGKIANYATINTSVLGLMLENAMQVPLMAQVRVLLHEIGGENPVHIGTDFEGAPVIGAGMLMSTVDFARYGRLLIADKEQVLSDREAASMHGELVPADLTYVDSRYYKSAIHNEFGIGHSGWAGQLIWADPESDIVIAMNGQLASELPAPFDHFLKLYQGAIDIVKYFRSVPSL
ncbi:serine hydrolase [Pseudomonas sp. MPC6]|uniref:serine hydrolase n=1 Tax=unclassified Pseudomonas TaxID=196821 RepID=UPI0013760C2A|nr:serine hydrolase [Pseudomonas sp. MPC6]